MNSAPSTNDAAFPLQIQEELLNQVRYWTTQAELKEKLNQEYDLKINEQERIIDALNKQRRLREESEGKLISFCQKGNAPFISLFFLRDICA